MRIVQEASPDWWVCEAVIPHDVPYVVKLSPRYLGEKQSRRRYFHSNINFAPFLKVSLFENPVKKLCVIASQRKGAIGTVKRGIATYSLEEACELQGVSPNFFGKDSPFLQAAKLHMIGNGVPLSMGRAVAKAVRKAVNGRE
jgi:DNA (cytosine-5)-methyltransferase 1